MQDQPKSFCSVIIPVFNSRATLKDCLQALLDQSVSTSDYEIIVVDDGSTDGSKDIAQQFPVQYIYQPNQGPAAARNKGAAVAKGDIVLFTDSDCEPGREWLSEMLSPFLQDNEVVAVKGAYKTKQQTIAARFAQVEFEDRYDLLARAVSIDMIDTYSAAFIKKIFIDSGGFDQSFPHANNEDTDLSYRLAMRGYKLAFNRRAFVYHMHPESLKKYLRVKFWRGYWRMIVYRRYPKKAVADTYTPVVIKIQTILMALSFFLFALSPLISLLFVFALASWVVIILTTLPFSIKAFKIDRIIGLYSPIIIFLRTGVFALGSILGVTKALFSKHLRDSKANAAM